MIFILIALLAMAVVSAADETEPEDLGVISPEVGILLHRDNSRPDWHAFYAEFYPQESYNTNMVALILTNEVVTVEDLAALPSGRTLLGLQNMFGDHNTWRSDGFKGAAKIYIFELRRAEPPAPSATRVHILPQAAYTNNPTIQEWIRLTKIKKGIADAPPLPMSTLAQKNQEMESFMKREFPPALPNSNKTTYSQHLDQMLETYRKQQGKRRNE